MIRSTPSVTAYSEAMSATPPSLPSSPEAATLVDEGRKERSCANNFGKHIDIRLGTIGGAGSIASPPGSPKRIADFDDALLFKKLTTTIADDTVLAEDAVNDNAVDDEGHKLKSVTGSSNEDVCIIERQLNLMEKEVLGLRTEFEGEAAAMPLSSDVQSGRQVEPPRLASSSSLVDDLHCRYGSFISELHSRQSIELQAWSDRLRERTDERDGALASAQGLEQMAMALQAEADQLRIEANALRAKHERHIERMKQDHARIIENKDKEIKELKKLLKSARFVDSNSQPLTQRKRWGFGNNRRRISSDDPTVVAGSSDDEGSDSSVESQGASSSNREEGREEGCCSESELPVAKTEIARLQHQLQSKDSEIEELMASNAAQASALYAARQETSRNDAEIEELTASNAAQASALYAARQEMSRLRAHRDILEIERGNEA